MIGREAFLADYETLQVSASGPVRHMTMNRPKLHNAQNTVMWDELRRAITTLAADQSVRVVVLAGAGSSFSSGIDLHEIDGGGFLGRIVKLANADPDQAHRELADVQNIFRSIRSAPFPVVAAVRGHAIGAGLQLALACDIRIVAATARMAFAESRRGVVPDLGATAFLPSVVGTQMALDLILTGREIRGAEAERIGLALRSVPDDALDDDVSAYATRLAYAPRHVLAHAKRATLEQYQDSSFRLAATGMIESLRHGLPSAEIMR